MNAQDHIRCPVLLALNSLSSLALAVMLGATCVPALASDYMPPKPGDEIRITVEQLPPPFETPSASNSPSIVVRSADLRPLVPAGFSASIFADHLSNPRKLLIAPDGAVLVAETQADKITILKDPGRTGHATSAQTLIDGFSNPFGMAFQGGDLYVADTRGVWRVAYDPSLKVSDRKPIMVTPPGAFGSGNGHITRSLVFSRDGRRFFVGIGSRGNIDEEEAPRATIQIFNADGSGQRTFASGLRNPIGIALEPGTDDLYAVINERDGLGDGLVPDYFTQIRDGAFYGWPYAYLGPHPQPRLGGLRPDLVAKAIVPDVLFRSHSAPIDMIFYDGDAFPADYRGSAFVALHGSWNAHLPSGYMVIQVPFAAGKPIGSYRAFATGFQIGVPDDSRAWGRPAGIVQASDGSLLIADDAGNTIWRVSYGR